MDKSEIIEIVRRYAVVVDQHLKPQKVILYGSYAKDNWREDSDIDVAIVVDRVRGDFLENAALLYKLRRNIDDRIEPILIEADNDKSGLFAEIQKHGQIISTI
ncbi:MAG TPA: nucleotidyltransferase domain-containing protein [Syntrophomonas sp.]|nr:nucleotidyltransferase domain-containing protein [Syntrophomonas sp.]